jgi:hypothetical protein
MDGKMGLARQFVPVVPEFYNLNELENEEVGATIRNAENG